MNVNRTIQKLDVWLEDNVCDSSWEAHKYLRDYLVSLKRMGYRDVVFKNNILENLKITYREKIEWLI